MSYVTNLILHIGILEDRDQRIEEVNQYFQKDDTKPLIFIEAPDRDWYGGDKYLECYLYVGAYNYLHLDGFIEHLKSLTWQEPESLQLIVKEQEDDKFRIIDIFPDQQEQLQTHNLFHDYLQHMGYQIAQDNPIFEELLHLYLSGEWGQMIEAEFAPIWIWQSHVAENLLEPYKSFSFNYTIAGEQ